MKKLTLLIALAFIIQATAISQPRLSARAGTDGNDAFGQACLPEGIYFTTQAQVDSFQINYPNCTEIEGNVTFNGEDITNLDSLNVLTSIEGDLNVGWWMYQNPSLISLEGLSNLTYIIGSLRIDRNALLVDLTGLDNLTSIGGELRIGTDWAKSEDGVIGNPSLISLKGLDNLSSIGEGISIEANNSLTSLTALDNVASIEGGISIEHNGALQNLEGLNNINPGSIHSLYFGYNHSLSRCEIESICSFLENPDGDINIYNNASGCNSREEVEEACGFNCLPEGITFTSQAQIDSFQVNYPSCTEIEGNVIISGEDIFDLSGLSLLESVTGLLEISNNVNLTSLSGLQNLNFISREFWDGGKLRIINNDVLINLNGLEGLTKLATGVANASGLEIHNNHMLISLSGIENIESNSIEYLSFQNNPSLANCDLQNICDYLVASHDFVTIENNDTGCNNQQEVEDACAQSVNEISNISKLSIHPNPFSNSITIEFELSQPESVTITFYNHLGKQLEVIEQKQPAGKQQVVWNAEGKPAGIYFCVIKTESGSKAMKMIKL